MTQKQESTLSSFERDVRSGSFTLHGNTYRTNTAYLVSGKPHYEKNRSTTILFCVHYEANQHNNLSPVFLCFGNSSRKGIASDPCENYSIFSHFLPMPCEEVFNMVNPLLSECSLCTSIRELKKGEILSAIEEINKYLTQSIEDNFLLFTT